jgi:osmoprotectant transport system permease protein
VSRRWTGAALVAGAVAAFAYVVSRQDWWAAALAGVFPSLPQSVYPSASVAELVAQHLHIVLISSAITIAAGVPLGVWVTRRSGRDFRDLVSAAVDFGQTFPPVAVLALMMPLLGLGPRPAIVALFLYGLFPVVSGTVAGIDAVPPSVLDAARGMGMGPWRILLTVELPLSARVIMGGIRTSVIVNIGTATVAATVPLTTGNSPYRNRATIAAVTGAGGLGAPIFSGITTQNSAFVLEGAAAAAMLAVLADATLGRLEELVTPRG